MYEDKLSTGERIGRGHFANVYRGKLNGKKVAVKVVERTPKNIIMQEISILQETIKMPSLLQFYGYCEAKEDDGWKFVMELADGTLKDLKEGMNIEDKMMAARDVAYCLHDLHAKRKGGSIIHRDIATRNVLRRQEHKSVEGKFCLSDFGLARVLNENGNLSSQ